MCGETKVGWSLGIEKEMEKRTTRTKRGDLSNWSRRSTAARKLA